LTVKNRDYTAARMNVGYAAAVRSMSMSWRDFFFGPFVFLKSLG
jgi:hypothetical protein